MAGIKLESTIRKASTSPLDYLSGPTSEYKKGNKETYKYNKVMVMLMSGGSMLLSVGLTSSRIPLS